MSLSAIRNKTKQILQSFQLLNSIAQEYTYNFQHKHRIVLPRENFTVAMSHYRLVAIQFFQA